VNADDASDGSRRPERLLWNALAMRERKNESS
jgi:hypothetical protein